jgi:sulfur carrier protein ThiS
VKVIAGVLTHNARTYGREEMLHDVVESLAVEADLVIVLNNGTTDGTKPLSDDQATSRCEVRVIERKTLDASQSRCAHGMNALLRALGTTAADVIVHSNDDVLWTPGWRARVQDVWRHAPASLGIVSGLVEESYDWNAEYGLARFGSEKMVLRETVPAGAWTMRRNTLGVVLPVPTAILGFDDLPVCDRLRGLKWDLAALDLAEHVGAGRSTWGNRAHGTGRPFDWEKWPVTRRWRQPVALAAHDAEPTAVPRRVSWGSVNASDARESPDEPA